MLGAAGVAGRADAWGKLAGRDRGVGERRVGTPPRPGGKLGYIAEASLVGAGYQRQALPASLCGPGTPMRGDRR